MYPETSLRRRGLTAVGWILLGLVWLLDVFSGREPDYRWTSWLPVVSGPLACAALLWPGRGPSTQVRAVLVAGGSLALTVGAGIVGPDGAGTWGLLESVALLALLPRAVWAVPRPRTAAAVSAALAVAAVAIPLRWLPRDLQTDGQTAINWCVLMALGAGTAVAWGLRARLLEEQRVRDIAAVRQRQRLELAHDLHDFVAHHVSGIIVQANAALTLQHTAPEQVGPLLENISRSGSETLDSMRRLVRVLREDDSGVLRPGEVWAELARLVSAFSEDEADVRLHVAAVAVRIDVDGPRLRVEVHNTAPDTGHPGPVGGRGGFGLVGLRERVEAVEGTLAATPTDDGGWRVTAAFPVLGSVEGSPA
ncbi:sensor histidine kinase [Streptomyces hayashii]|uniref:sensor histidine kinase n=1 Tax=Streptomyces hayashii TaxID=2839966 RepID=UPI00403D389D